MGRRLNSYCYYYYLYSVSALGGTDLSRQGCVIERFMWSWTFPKFRNETNAITPIINTIIIKSVNTVLKF